MTDRFPSRAVAGRLLARQLTHYAGRDDVVVLGLARGGIVVAAEVARALAASIDVFLVRKLGVLGHKELAFGAIASGGVGVIKHDLVRRLGIPDSVVASVRSVKERARAYRVIRPRWISRRRDPAEKIVILVDDGIATGATMEAAVQSLWRLDPARIVVAAPVVAASSVEQFRAVAEEVVAVLAPEGCAGVGQCYEGFERTTDAEVIALRDRAWPG